MNKRQNVKILSFSFFIPIIFVGFIWGFSGVVPFGNHTLMTGDLNNQYVALFAYFKQNIFHPENFLYSGSLTLGGNFVGVFTYYLLNPLNYLVIFFPINKLPLFFTTLITLKIGLSGLTMYVFLTRSKLLLQKISSNGFIEYAAVIVSSSFALMGYIFLYKECLMWLDAVIMLPLVMLGVDRIFTQKKMNLYIISLTYTIIVNYYMGVIVGLFSCLSFVFMFLKHKVLRKNTDVDLLVIVRFIICNLISGLMSAVVLIPSYLSVSGVDKNSGFAFKPIYNIGDLFRQAISGDLGNNVPLIFVGYVVLVFFVMFFFNSKIDFLDKIYALIFCAVLFISSWIDVLYLIWHVFSWPNGYAQRESFVLVFAVCVIAFQALSNLKFSEFPSKLEFIGTFITVVVILVVARGWAHTSIRYILFFCICTMIVFSLVYIPTHQKITFGGILLVSLISLFVVNMRTVNSQIANGARADAYKRYVCNTQEVIQKIKSNDNSAYRIGNDFQSSDNDPLLFNFKGLSNYVSQQKTSLTDFMSASGYYQKFSWHRWSNYNNGSTLAMDRLLGIKYTISNTSNKFTDTLKLVNKYMYGNQSYEAQINSTKQIFNVGKNKIAKDDYAFPLVFKITREHAIPYTTNYDPESDPFLKLNHFFKSISKVAESNLYSQQYVMDEKNGVYKISVTKSGMAYIYLPENRNTFPGMVKIYCNNKLISKLYSDESENGIVSLGRFKAGEQVDIRFKATSSKQFRTPYVAVENENLLKKMYSTMVDKNIHDIEYDGNNFKFKTSTSFRGEKVMLSIPYDSSWKVWIDGKKETLKSGSGKLTTLKVGKGQHEVDLRYFVPGLRLGTYVSIIGVGLFAFVNIRHKRKKSKILKLM